MIQIRPYAPKDAGILARIFHDAVQIGSAGHYNQAQRDDWSPKLPDTDKFAARHEGLTVWIAEDDGDPVGYLAMRDDDGLIDMLFVVPDRIGSGVAYALYAVALNHARTPGLSRLWVEASAQSQVFFARQGWIETGRRIVGEGDGEIEICLMALDQV